MRMPGSGRCSDQGTLGRCRLGPGTGWASWSTLAEILRITVHSSVNQGVIAQRDECYLTGNDDGGLRPVKLAVGP